MKYFLLAFLFLSGCASNELKDFNCYKVTGPQTASGPIDKEELQKLVEKLDPQVKLFEDKPTSYVCVDVTSIKELREYPRGK